MRPGATHRPLEGLFNGVAENRLRARSKSHVKKEDARTITR
jgi:hypothetical protein